jgi:hypothetical protein
MGKKKTNKQSIGEKAADDIDKYISAAERRPRG